MFKIDDDLILNTGLYVQPNLKKYGISKLLSMNGERKALPDTNVKEELMRIYDLDLSEYESMVDPVQRYTMDTFMGDEKSDSEYEERYNTLHKMITETSHKLLQWDIELGTLIINTLLNETNELEAEMLISTCDKRFNRYEKIKEYAHNVFDSYERIRFTQTAIRRFFEDNYYNKFDIKGKYLYVKTLKITTAMYLTDGFECTVCYYFTSLDSYVRYLFQRFFEYKLPLCKCEYCGRFFIPKTNKLTKYCDRVIEENKTCKYVGAKLTHKESVRNDEVLKLYEITKDKLYKQTYVTDNDWGIVYRFFKEPPDYYEWKDRAFLARTDYLDDKITAEEAKKIIKIEEI